MKYDFTATEKKWQKRWEETGLYKFDKNSDKPKQYVLEMFSYPSGAKLHVGHWYNYGLSDTYARFRRMQEQFGLEERNVLFRL